MSDFQYVKNAPQISEKEMQTKLEEIKFNVGSKMKTWADRLQFSMAFTPKIERFEGEVWSEDGKRWIMTDGIKRSYSVLQDARMPWWCPKCKRTMNHRFDRKFYYLRGHCFNCNVEFEGAMRINGTWDEFERRLLRENEKSILRDKIEEHIAYMKDFRVPQMHFGDGRWEQLGTMKDYAPKFEQLQSDIDFMLGRLEEIRQEEEKESLTTMEPVE